MLLELEKKSDTNYNVAERDGVSLFELTSHWNNMGISYSLSAVCTLRNITPDHKIITLMH